MSEILQDHIQNFLEEFNEDESPKNFAYRAYAEDHHIPIIDEEVKEFLSFFLNTLKPKRILELGTAMGYSSIWMSRLKSVERVDTIEVREDMYALAKENLERAQVENVHQYLGDAKVLLDQLEGPYDFIFIDAAKGQYPYYFEKAQRLLAKGGVIGFDNVLFRGMISNQDLVKRRKITIVKRLRKLLQALKEDHRFEKTLIPLGDGFLLVRSKDV